MRTSQLIKSTVLLGCLLIGALSAQAQSDFPNKPIKWVVATALGALQM